MSRLDPDAATRAVAQRYYDAVLAGDIASVLDMVHDDIILREATSLPYGGIHRGCAAFVVALQGASQFVDLESIEVDGLIVDGERAAALVTCRPPHDPSAEPMLCLDWLLIRGGKIVELTPFYFDTAAMMTAAKRDCSD